MSDTILQKFADAGFLRQMNPQAEDFQNLSKASTRLVKELKKKTKKDEIIPYILIALNPDINPNEPRLDEVEGFIKKEIPLFRGSSNDRPIQIIRTVILFSLEKLAKADINYSSIIWNLSKDYISTLSLNHEEFVLKEFLKSIGLIVEQNALGVWGIKREIGISLNLETDSTTENDKNDIVLKFQKKLKEFEPPNSMAARIQINNQWTQQNIIRFSDFNTWHEELIALLSINQELNQEVKLKLDQGLRKVSNFIETKLNNSLDKFNIIAQREQLLWWKESLYSQSANKSYRSISPSIYQSIIMAYDYFKLTPLVCPESADYFLKETLFKVLDEDKSISFSDLLPMFVIERELLQNYFDDNGLKEGIIPLMDFISALVYGKLSEAEFKIRTGIDKEKSISFSDLTLTIFHQLKAKAFLKK